VAGEAGVPARHLLPPRHLHGDARPSVPSVLAVRGLDALRSLETGSGAKRVERNGAAATVAALARLPGTGFSREMGSWGGREANGEQRAGRGSRRRRAEQKEGVAKRMKS